jgi:superfamily I DNA/RNA helicase
LDDRLVIDELCGSFERQLSLYRELRDTVRSTLSRLILSRGDAAALIAGIEKKKKLLEKIEKERADSSKFVEYWQQRRSALALRDDAAILNGILAQMESVIKEFLLEEEKLKSYLEKMYKMGGGGQSS